MLLDSPSSECCRTASPAVADKLKLDSCLCSTDACLDGQLEEDARDPCGQLSSQASYSAVNTVDGANAADVANAGDVANAVNAVDDGGNSRGSQMQKGCLRRRPSALEQQLQGLAAYTDSIGVSHIQANPEQP